MIKLYTTVKTKAIQTIKTPERNFSKNLSGENFYLDKGCTNYDALSTVGQIKP
jgi:uncharacterized protein with ATP-grasp and redox domains